ncbi:Plasminogen [Harpegnathos saltator]|uniref:Plasminogen n=1 Tax=Harpegnathos saltator TaxID=610380 RepID=E2BWN4_HARSA|nr:Plasminogen [Harpegnathos saltator]
MRVEQCFPFITFLQALILVVEAYNASRTDLSRCKLSQLGSEYKGSIVTTVGGFRCQSWVAEQPLHKIRSDITDADFPERSMKLAKNYCRNPTRDLRGPWCYTLEPTVMDDECDVPLCNYGDCIITGLGAEYGGSRSFSSSRRKCKSWNKRYKLGNTKSIKFHNKHFPDGSRTKANNYCRNPDDDIGGPWCYVEEKSYELVEKEHCDIPFCDDRDCLMYSRNSSTYSTLTGLNSTYGNISLWIKLWNPLDEQNAEARILLSLLPIPSSAEKIAQDWKAGVELFISNSVSGQTYPVTDNGQLFEDTPGMLLSSKWTGLWITWGGGFISLGIHGISKPLIMDEYRSKNNISSLYPDSFLHYGVMGTGVLWSTEFCQNYCESHTTFGDEFLTVWPMQKSNDTQDVRFYVRASRDIKVRLYQSPGVLFPCFTLEIKHNDIIFLSYQETERAVKQYLKEVIIKGSLDYWIWKKFTISIFGTHLRLISQLVSESEEILFVNHDLLATLRWFSVASNQTIAHWTFFCPPDAMDAVEDPQPPNCIHNFADYEYRGTQWTSERELPCVPWVAKEVPDSEKIADNFVDRSIAKVLNRCRNPTNDPSGPYCYAVSTPHATDVIKRYCTVRICRSSECRMAGTANDYIGTLSTTRSGRTCAKWLSDYDLEQMQKPNASLAASVASPSPARVSRSLMEQNVSSGSSLFTKSPSLPPPKLLTKSRFAAVKPVHSVDRAYWNDSLYPERSVRNASNYCRDPSRNIAGTWCYTTDPLVPQDLCDVRDCEKPEECTFFVKGHGIGRRLYVFPEHRTEGLHFSLKAWEPDRPDSITFVFTADDGLKSRYILKIGALDNEKVLLYYQSEEKEIALVKKKTLPHLLYLGKWSSFVIRIPRGRVLVYYAGAPDPLFEWEHPEPAKAFLPVYYYYNSEKGHAIGVAFDCASRCHIENTQTDRYTRILPVSTWSKEDLVRPNKLTLMIRAEGVIWIPLLLLPATPGFYALMLGKQGRWIHFLKNTYPSVKVYHKQKAPMPIFASKSWTNITIKWSGSTIDVFCNETIVFHYVHRLPLIFYFFSLAVDAGSWATWSANCMPSDGGWSEWGPWACSASCNGGIGTRKRYCNSPEPNVKGEPCIGPSSMTGRCNMILCGDITDDTVTLIKRAIAQNYTALTVHEDEPISLPSDLNIVSAVRTESPDSEVQWSHNGIFLQEEEHRLEIKDYEIIISRATLNDSGVYTLTVHRIDGTYMIFKVATLAVVPMKESVTIRETLSMNVKCHCIILGYVYSDLKVYWTIDDRVWKDYGVTLPVAANVDHLPAVNKSHHGTWKCVVEQVDLNFKWTTNMIRVKGMSKRERERERERERKRDGMISNSSSKSTRV